MADPTHALLLVVDTGDPREFGAQEMGRGTEAEMQRLCDRLVGISVSTPGVTSASLHVVTIAELDRMKRPTIAQPVRQADEFEDRDVFVCDAMHDGVDYD